jgi:hypothetical protein
MTPKPLTLDYLKSLKLCWSASMLEAAAKEWPADPSWAWFLGEHIASMERKNQQLRLAVAFALISGERYELPGMSAGAAWGWFKKANASQYTAAAAALGAWLDALDTTTSDALAALLQQER